MSSRYYITHQSVSLNCGMLTVNMTSGSAQHLWLLWTVKYPYVRPRPFRGQESTVPHQNNYSLEIMGDVEQEEPGNTFTHTFTFPWPGQADTLFFYSINQGTGGLKATRSPIFVYRLEQRDIINEDWSLGLTGKYPWTTFYSDPAPTFIPSLNSLVMVDNSQNGCGVVLDLRPILQNAGLSVCDLLLQVGAAKLSGPPNLFALTQLSVGVTPNTFSDELFFFHQWNGLDPCAFGVLHGQQALSAFSGISYRTGIGAAAYHPSWLCATTPLPFDPAYAVQITLAQTTAGNPSGPGALRTRWGPVIISAINGLLADISGEWKGISLAPFIP